MVEVTHIVPSPGTGFVATQPGGRAGAVTESQFSTHGVEGVAEGDGEGVPLAVGLGPGDGLPVGVGVGTGISVPRS